MLMHSAPPRHEASSAEFIEILPEAPFTGAEVQDLTEILPEAPFTGAEVQDLTEILPPPRHKASSARFIGGSAKILAFGEYSPQRLPPRQRLDETTNGHEYTPISIIKSNSCLLVVPIFLKNSSERAANFPSSSQAPYVATSSTRSFL